MRPHLLYRLYIDDCVIAAGAAAFPTMEEKMESDARSVYVGNVSCLIVTMLLLIIVNCRWIIKQLQKS